MHLQGKHGQISLLDKAKSLALEMVLETKLEAQCRLLQRPKHSVSLTKINGLIKKRILKASFLNTSLK